MLSLCLLVHIQPCSAPGLGLSSAVGLHEGESMVLNGPDPLWCHTGSPWSPSITPAVSVGAVRPLIPPFPLAQMSTLPACTCLPLMPT